MNSLGIAFAPSLLQKTMDTILQGTKQVICCIDDILITGRNDRAPEKLDKGIPDSSGTWN